MRILIVEDEAGVRSFLRRAVERIIPGADVVAEPNGRLALANFLADPADLVISDNRMPQISGMELLRALREGSAAPFIMISAEPSQEQQALAAGAAIYLTKPVGLDDLRTAIRYALRSSIGYTEPCAK